MRNFFRLFPANLQLKCAHKICQELSSSKNKLVLVRIQGRNIYLVCLLGRNTCQCVHISISESRLRNIRVVGTYCVSCYYRHPVLCFLSFVIDLLDFQLKFVCCLKLFMLTTFFLAIILMIQNFHDDKHSFICTLKQCLNLLFLFVFSVFSELFQWILHSIPEHQIGKYSNTFRQTFVFHVTVK